MEQREDKGNYSVSCLAEQLRVHIYCYIGIGYEWPPGFNSVLLGDWIAKTTFWFYLFPFVFILDFFWVFFLYYFDHSGESFITTFLFYPECFNILSDVQHLPSSITSCSVFFFLKKKETMFANFFAFFLFHPPPCRGWNFAFGRKYLRFGCRQQLMPVTITNGPLE